MCGGDEDVAGIFFLSYKMSATTQQQQRTYFVGCLRHLRRPKTRLTLRVSDAKLERLPGDAKGYVIALEGDVRDPERSRALLDTDACTCRANASRLVLSGRRAKAASDIFRDVKWTNVIADISVRDRTVDDLVHRTTLDSKLVMSVDTSATALEGLARDGEKNRALPKLSAKTIVRRLRSDRDVSMRDDETALEILLHNKPYVKDVIVGLGTHMRTVRSVRVYTPDGQLTVQSTISDLNFDDPGFRQLLRETQKTRHLADVLREIVVRRL